MLKTTVALQEINQQRWRDALDGLPSWREDLDWIYEDLRERLHVTRMTVRDGRV